MIGCIFLFLWKCSLVLGAQRQIDFFTFANKSQDFEMSASQRATMVTFLQNGMPEAFKQAEEEFASSNDIPSRQSLCGQFHLNL
jgi:hypothetical protein